MTFEDRPIISDNEREQARIKTFMELMYALNPTASFKVQEGLSSLKLISSAKTEDDTDNVSFTAELDIPKDLGTPSEVQAILLAIKLSL